MTDYITREGILAAREQGWDALLREFRKRVHPKHILTLPKKGNPPYVPHFICRQYIDLAFDEVRLEVERDAEADGGVVVWARLYCTLKGETRTFPDYGQSNNSGDAYKSALSDAQSRIGGLGLGIGRHLWCQHNGNDLYFLDKPASDDPSEAAPADTPPEPAGASTSVSEPTEDGGGEDGEASPPPTTNARAAMQRAFHAILGEMDLVYETEPESLPTDVKNWMIGRYGNSLSGITDEELRALVGSLSSDNPKHAKNRARFAGVVSA